MRDNGAEKGCKWLTDLLTNQISDWKTEQTK